MTTKYKELCAALRLIAGTAKCLDRNEHARLHEAATALELCARVEDEHMRPSAEAIAQAFYGEDDD